MIGKTISHYKIIEELGRGGMGIVYKAEDTKLKRTVALKFLPPQLTRDEEAKKRFVQEAQTASALEHNNICVIHEIDETADGQLYISMAYCEGESLKNEIGKGPFKIEKCVDIAIQIAQGLAKAHARNIIHRDIKSANIMIDYEGVVKIVDFGLAKLKGQAQLTKEGITLGTIAYMSPEQTQGASVDERTDIWSLGILLYEMVTGQLPFKGDYDQAIMYSILNENPEPISQFRTDVPPVLAEIIEKALQKNPVERYQNIKEMLSNLKALKTSFETGSVKVRSTTRVGRKKHTYIYGSIVLLILIVLTALYLLTSYREAVLNAKSIAVLPFKNLSEDPGNEYFSDGITEDVIAQLAKIADLKVISRTSAMLYKNSEKSIKDIGKELNVAWILEGSVRRADNQVRIVAQLIDANKDVHLWVDTYDEELTQIFTIQSDVAQKIVSSLEMKISPVQKDRIEKKATENLEAYDLYLKGRYYWNKRLPDELRKSIEYFQQAIEIDSTYALAYSGLADAYTILGNFNVLPPQETYPKAKAAAANALEIDSLLGEAHTSLAYAKIYADWDWSGAEKEFRQGMALNPGNANAFSWYAFFLTAMGRFNEATKVRKRAQELDPLSIVISAEIGLEFYFERKFDRAIEQCQKTLEMNPLFHAAYIPLGGAFVQKKIYEDAIATFSKASLFSKGHPVTVAALGYTYAVSGRREDALMMVELLEERSVDEYVSPYWMAAIYAGLDDKERTLEWLERAYEEKDGSMVFLKVIPIFDSLRSNPRFISILKNMGLEL
jgi:serine/threonine protein kinase/Tfp pilus assembly protein PilF